MSENKSEMLRVSISELHQNTSRLVGAAEHGEVVIITDEAGVALAEMVGVSKPGLQKAPVPFPDLSELWERMPEVDADSTLFISQDRDRGQDW